MWVFLISITSFDFNDLLRHPDGVLVAQHLVVHGCFRLLPFVTFVAVAAAKVADG